MFLVEKEQLMQVPCIHFCEDPEAEVICGRGVRSPDIRISNLLYFIQY